MSLAARARALGKYIVLLHPGRSSAARASAETHTGAMAGDYDVMRTKVTHAGVVVAETLEELLDVSEILLRCPSLPARGAAVLTESGAFKALSLDFCEMLDLPLPALSDATAAALRQAMPDFIPATNPLDITAHALVDPDLYRRTLPPILADQTYSSLVLGIILTDEATSRLKFPPILHAIRALKPSKAIIFAGLDEGALVPPSYVSELRALGVPFFPSPERAFRALACVTAFAAQQNRAASEHRPLEHVPELMPGVMPEYRSKQVLQALGIPIPQGALARNIEEAQAIARKIGHPVALKAQSAQLSHKSDAGGVVLNLGNPEEVAAGWRRMHADIDRARSGLVLDGVLVEVMGAHGAELIAGARNDPDWGAVLLIGSGGVYAEVLKDVRLIPPDLSVEAIVDEIYKLKRAVLFRGFRGHPALDVRAVAEILHRLGVFVLAAPEVNEVDINPVIVYPEGQGAVALDALIVTRT